MKEDIKIPKKLPVIAKIMSLLSWLLFVGVCTMIIVGWDKIPSTIPMHFNSGGHVDRYGDKDFLIFIIFIGFFMLAIFQISSYITKLRTDSSTVTPAQQVLLPYTLFMMSAVKLVTTLLFTLILFSCANSSNLPSALLPIFIILILAPIIWYFVTDRVISRRFPTEAAKNETSSDLLYKSPKEIRNSKGNVVLSCHSKIDWWLGFLLILPLLINLGFTIEHFTNGEIGWDGILIILFVNIVLIFPLLLDTRYTLYDNCLHIRMAYWANEWIPYENINEIETTNSMLSSASLSLDRINIEYRKRGRRTSIMISPKKKKEFLEIIKEKCDRK